MQLSKRVKALEGKDEWILSLNCLNRQQMSKEFNLTFKEALLNRTLMNRKKAMVGVK
jgi:hypothetical protein